MSALPEAIDQNPSIQDLLAAAMRACDHWNDSPPAREQMRRDLAAVPPEHQADLMAHFDRTYPAPGTNPWRA